MIHAPARRRGHAQRSGWRWMAWRSATPTARSSSPRQAFQFRRDPDRAQGHAAADQCQPDRHHRRLRRPAPQRCRSPPTPWTSVRGRSCSATRWRWPRLLPQTRLLRAVAGRAAVATADRTGLRRHLPPQIQDRLRPAAANDVDVFANDLSFIAIVGTARWWATTSAPAAWLGHHGDARLPTRPGRLARLCPNGVGGGHSRAVVTAPARPQQPQQTRRLARLKYTLDRLGLGLFVPKGGAPPGCTFAPARISPSTTAATASAGTGRRRRLAPRPAHHRRARGGSCRRALAQRACARSRRRWPKRGRGGFRLRPTRTS